MNTTKVRADVLGIGLVVMVGSLIGLSDPVHASEVVYNNLRNDLKRFYYSGDEIGDEVILESNSGPILSVDIESLSFEMVGRGLSGNETAQVRIYENDSPKKVAGSSAPGTLRFESEPFDLPQAVGETLVFTVDVPVGVTNLPPHFTWTLKVTGVELTEQLGISLYSPPVKGNNYNDFWVNVEGQNWVLQQIRNLPSDFAAIIVASEVRIKPVEKLRLEILKAVDGTPELTLRSPTRNRLFIVENSLDLKDWKPVSFYNNAVLPKKFLPTSPQTVPRQFYRILEFDNIRVKHLGYENGNHVLSIEGGPGLRYKIQATSRLNENEWKTLLEIKPETMPHRVLLPSTLFESGSMPVFFRVSASVP